VKLRSDRRRFEGLLGTEKEGFIVREEDFWAEKEERRRVQTLYLRPEILRIFFYHSEASLRKLKSFIGKPLESFSSLQTQKSFNTGNPNFICMYNLNANFFIFFVILTSISVYVAIYVVIIIIIDY
jgi:hypothetical protein